MVLLLLIQLIVYTWSILTWPLYFLIYRPWTKTRKFHRKRAEQVGPVENDEVVYRTIPYNTRVRKQIIDENLDTMDQVWNRGVLRHTTKRCLGTRRIIEEKKVPGPNDKKFTKLVMDPTFKWLNYNEVDQKSTYIGRGLQLMGLKPKDKLVMYCDTKAEWMVTALGCFKFNYTMVTIYTNLGEDGVTYGIHQTQSNYVCTSQELLPKLIKVLDKLPHVHTIIVIEEPWKGEVELLDAKYQGKKSLYTWKSVYISGRENANIEPTPPNSEDIAILMYTSGSTGNPKGVMLSHGNLVAGVKSLGSIAEVSCQPIKNDDVYIGYLPLAHVLELLAESCMLFLGIGIGYSSPNSLTDTSTMIMPGAKGDATILRPSVMCSVPAVLDKIYKGINSKINASGPFMAQLVDFCVRYRATWFRRGYDTPIMNRLIFAKFKALVGGNVRVLLSGGAPLAEKSHQFIRTALCTAVHQGYGLTETSSTGTVTDPDDLSLGCVGAPLLGADFKLVSWNEGGYSVTDTVGPRGEIHIGGDNIATGYFDMPEKTAEEFYEKDGKRWFKTGDIGQAMPDGSFKIIDRKKDLVKLQMGEYVSLGKVESVMKIHNLIENICVCAKSSESFTVAIIVPEHSTLVALSSKLISKDSSGMTFEDLCFDDKVLKEVLKKLTTHGLSLGLEKFEIPKQIYLTSDPWTPDSGLVTAAMKLKRKEIENRYAAAISQMYAKMTTPTANKIETKGNRK